MSRASNAQPTLPVGTVIMVEEKNDLLYVYDQFGNEVAEEVPKHVVRSCYDTNMCAELRQTSPGNFQWRKVERSVYDAARPHADNPEAEQKANKVMSSAHTINVAKIDNAAELQESPDSHAEIVEFLKTCYDYKPSLLKIAEISWRFAVRAALRGENLLLLGDSGTGKTLLAQTLPKVLKRPYFYFNMGATQDARSTLIGNTHFKEGEGTYVAESLFVTAIQTPNAVILLDELSRAHPDAQNILMTVLDKKQRYLRIDEKPDTPTIEVAKGVCFIATANVGTEYSATRTMDRAMLDRFTTLKIPHLNKDDEVELLAGMFPSLDPELINQVAEIADDTRQQIRMDNPRVSTIISTRMTTEMAALLHDGFTLKEVADVCIFPFYSEAGGPDSELAYMKILVQRYTGDSSDNDPITGNDPDSIFGG